MKKVPIYPTPPIVVEYFKACDKAEDEDKAKPRPPFEVIEYLAIVGYKKQFSALDRSAGQTLRHVDNEAYTEEIRYHLEQTHPNKNNAFFVMGKYTPERYEGDQIFQHTLTAKNLTVKKAAELYSLGKKMSLYASQADYLPTDRRTSNNAQSVAALTVDIDFYNIPQYAAICADLLYPQIVSEVFAPLGVVPNYGINSGHGLYLVFLLEPLTFWGNPQHRAAYSQTLKKLVELTRQYGSDPAATDLARVFRLPTTRNPKTGAYSRIINFEQISSTPQERHSLFAIMPKLGVALPPPESDPTPWITAAEPQTVPPPTTIDRKSKPIKPSKPPKTPKAPKGDTGKPYIDSQKLTLQSLGRARATDLYTWLDNRNFDIKGHRNTFFLIFASAILSYMPPAAALQYIKSINSRLIEPQAETELIATFNGAVRNYKKRKTETTGYYSFDNAYIIEQLGITAKEIETFYTIITPAEKQRRDTLRHRAARRNEQGNTKRQQDKADKQAQIAALLQEGKSQAHIAKLLGISRQLVNRYAKVL